MHQINILIWSLTSLLYLKVDCKNLYSASNKQNIASDIANRLLKDGLVNSKIDYAKREKFSQHSINRRDLISDLLQGLVDQLENQIHINLEKLLNDIKDDQRDSLTKINEQKDLIPAIVGNVTKFVQDAKNLIEKVTAQKLNVNKCNVSITESAGNLMHSIETAGVNCLNQLIERVNSIVDPVVENIKNIREKSSKLIQEGLKCIDNILACEFGIGDIVESISSTTKEVGDLIDNVGQIHTKLFLGIPIDIMNCFSPTVAADVIAKLMELIMCLQNMFMSQQLLD